MWMIGVSFEMARQWLMWSRTTGTLEHSHSSLLCRWVQRLWRGCDLEHEASKDWWARPWCSERRMPKKRVLNQLDSVYLRFWKAIVERESNHSQCQRMVRQFSAIWRETNTSRYREVWLTRIMAGSIVSCCLANFRIRILGSITRVIRTRFPLRIISK